MDELERQIVAWVDAETEGVDPVTPAEAMGAMRPTATMSPQGRPRGALAVAAAAAVAVLLGGLVVVAARRDRGAESVRLRPLATTTTTLPTAPLPGADWTRFRQPTFDWTLDRPIRTGLQSWSERCPIQDSGSFITFGTPDPIRFADTSSSCVSTPSAADLRRPGIVVLSISHFVGSPYGPADLADTSQPIELEDLLPVPDDPPGGPTQHALQVVIDGDPRYSVQVWVGPEAEPADLADLERMLSTMRWPEEAREADGAGGPTTRGGEVAPASGSSRMTTFIACMSDAGYHPYLADPPAGTVDGEVAATLTWPDGEQDRASYGSDHDRCNRVASQSQRRRSGSTLVWPLRAGASQTPAEAKRDGVVPALAEFPLDARAVPTEWFDAPEGTWAITKMPQRPDGSDCTVGEPDGAWGTEQICSVEYGEVVLVDEAGRLLRAYPMPGEVPTWIYPTKDAVYAGRVGDGALPESAIARIDRGTLEAEVLVFPTEGGLLGVDLPGWSAAPSSADIGRLVVVGDDSAGPLVASTIGMTSVDLDAVEELFA